MSILSSLMKQGHSMWIQKLQKPFASINLFNVPKAGYAFTVPQNYDDVEFPEKNKLGYVNKVPQYPGGVRAPKMQKKLIYMRGPETIHNKLIHKQYGIVALGPGRLKYGHFEMIRLTLTKKMNPKTQFCIWRIDPPWQAVTKRGHGKRLGGGKGAIDHYVTPIRHGRIIVEMGGKCSYKEVYNMLRIVAEKLPFPAKVVSEEMMIAMENEKKWKEENNLNPYTFKYVVQNNMGGSHLWITPYDRIWFNEHT